LDRGFGLAAKQRPVLILAYPQPVTPARKELLYQTRSSWSRARRVIAKAEVNVKGDNPRFIVTNIPEEGISNAECEKGVSPCICAELTSWAMQPSQGLLRDACQDLRD
jgi:hypothetical protein